MDFAFNKFEAFSSFLKLYIPFNFNSIKQAFKKFLKKSEEGVIRK